MTLERRLEQIAAMSTPPLSIPRQLVTTLDRDLVAAGIARRVQVEPGKWKIDKRDERGRTVNVHALRHTCGTLLSTSGIAPRTAQQAMRHSEIGLTMNVYTDPRLLDVAGAVEALPNLSLDSMPAELQRQVATGTDGPRTVAKTVANAADVSAQKLTIRDNRTDELEVFGKQKNLAKPIRFARFLAVGATRRLLNFSWPASGAGKPGCGVGWMTVSRTETESYGSSPWETLLLPARPVASDRKANLDAEGKVNAVHIVRGEHSHALGQPFLAHGHDLVGQREREAQPVEMPEIDKSHSHRGLQSIPATAGCF